MNIKTNSISVFCLAFIVSIPLMAAENDEKNKSDNIYVSDNELERISVEWVSPKSFSDVRETNSSRLRFRKYVFSQLEKHLEELAQELPLGQSLTVSVTNVDLAGRVEPASFAGLSHSTDDIRILRDVDIPRLTFAYKLLDEQGNVLKEEQVKLKNMSYLYNGRIGSRNEPFQHEKKMLSKWFAKSIVEGNA